MPLLGLSPASVLVVLAAVYSSHAEAETQKAGNLLHETFSTPLEGRWISSSDELYTGKAELKDNGLVLPEEAKRYGISSSLTTPWTPGKPLVVQYELTFTEGGLECGGSYLKLLSGTPDLPKMNESDGFTVMFGPDKCGATNKVHLIVKHKNPVTGKAIEHHASKPAQVKIDKLPHLYTLVIRPDNTFSVSVDMDEAATGSLTSAGDFEPPFTPPKQIPDPDEKKPEDWVDDAQIEDPEAIKPEDWDEEAPAQIPDESVSKPSEWHDEELLQISDPEASKPEDWSEEDDGSWEAPLVNNPKCDAAGCGEWKRPNIPNPDFKGKWSPPMIDNPAYKGEWTPKDIDNPDYFDCKDPSSGLEPIGAVAVEVWLFKPKGPKFSNIVVGTDENAAQEFAKSSWKVQFDIAQAKASKEAALAAEQAKKKQMEEGGWMGILEVYMRTAVDYPMISIPALLVFFFGLVKWATGEKQVAEEHRDDSDQGPAEAEPKAAPAEGLRQRKTATAKDN